MCVTPTPQEQMDAAFENHLALSKILRENLLARLESESDSQHWRHNYIRVGAPLIEGYASNFRQIRAVSVECLAPEISKKEAKILCAEQNFNANERIKLMLRVAHTLF